MAGRKTALKKRRKPMLSSHRGVKKEGPRGGEEKNLNKQKGGKRSIFTLRGHSRGSNGGQLAKTKEQTSGNHPRAIIEGLVT